MYNLGRINNARHLNSYSSIVIACSLLLLSFNVHADHEIFKSNQGVAIYGFDPVAYFTLGKTTEGSKDIVLDRPGAIWRFASEENREIFFADPGSYIPA
jgi:hypothetical protein